MKKKVIRIFIIQFLVIIIGILLIKLFININWKKDFDRFDYNDAKKTTINLLEKNEEQLKTIVDKLYENKSKIENPLKNIKNAEYYKSIHLNFKNEEEYIEFNIDAQGMLGGQYYGLIYSKNDNDELIIYDENKELGKGNNIFIRQKIKNNWYFYYDDYDGKVNTKKLQDIK